MNSNQMFKKTSAIILFLFGASVVQAQSLSVSPVSRATPSSYLLTPAAGEGGDYPVTMNPSSIRFDRTGLDLHEFAGYNVSEDDGLFAVLSTKGGEQSVLTEEDPGKQLIDHKLSFDITDPSLKIYALNNGRFIVRSNISHFDVYGVTGHLLATVNNSSGSLKGETISRLATDKNNRTILVYNPRIDRSGYVECRIQRLDIASGQLNEIYDHKNEKIDHLRLSDDGMFVSVVSGSHVHIIDAFGNTIQSLDFNKPVDGSTISHDNRYVTCWYGNRILVYNLLSGKKLGSTTLRGPSLLYAGYVPEDHLILGVAGELDSKSRALRNIQIEGIDLKRRKIAKGGLSGTLFWHKKLFSLNVDRESDGHYRLTGLSEPLAIKTEF